ncbi:hypothetical protein V5O48_003645 [Marasmius crinis-equi]|uniref:BAH domain-containing protein n=1 Tax=Marasmius crinis-equi TaxID=585013 RepID=A0ABR3FSA0_9AGAR
MPHIVKRKTVQKSSSKSKSKSRQPGKKRADDDYGTPTDAEWNAMEDVEEIIVSVSDQDDEAFSVGDKSNTSLPLQNVIIHPEGIPLNKGGPGPILEKMWVAEIVKIKQRERDGIWAKVRWYFSPEEAGELVKSLDPTMCGKFERLNSNHFDYIHYTTIDGRLDIQPLHLSGLLIREQGSIPRNQMSYYRYSVSKKSRKSTLWTIKPRPSDECSLCSKPYAPPDSPFARESGTTADLSMRVCARSTCMQSYHAACLANKGYILEEPADLPDYESDRRVAKRRRLEIESDRTLIPEIRETVRALCILGAFYEGEAGTFSLETSEREDYSLISNILSSIAGDPEADAISEAPSDAEKSYVSETEDENADNAVDTGSPNIPQAPPVLPPSVSARIPRTLLTLALQPLVRGLHVNSGSPSSPPFDFGTLQKSIFDWGYRSSNSFSRANKICTDIAGNVGVVFRAREELLSILRHAMETASDSKEGDLTFPEERMWIESVFGGTFEVDIDKKGGGSSFKRALNSTASCVEADLSLIAPYVVKLPPRGIFSVLAGTSGPRVTKGRDTKEAWKKILDEERSGGRDSLDELPWLICPRCGRLI